MISINPPTASLLLDEFVQLRSGDYVVINAANSSIARWIVAFAKKKGVRLVGLVRRPDALEAARSSGCELVVLDDGEAPNKVGEVLGQSRPRLALDAVGGDASGRLIKLLGPEGTFVSYAAPTYAPMEISPFDVVFKDLKIRGFSMGYPRFASKIPPAIDEAAKMIVDGQVHVPITATYPLEEFKAAMAHALRGGKILLSATN
jgi:NADPH:quinone reductase-like Zn-dependent oxidoreductase